MKQLKNHGDIRERGLCVYCGDTPDSRDHVPSKVLLDEPLPDNLHVVDSCTPCNNGFSLDEQYFAALLECILCGGSEGSLIRKDKIRRLLDTNQVLRSRLEKSRHPDNNGASYQIEYSRVENIVLKLARGHAAYESGSPRLEKPVSCVFVPIQDLTDEQLSKFELIPKSGLWPEIGTRAFQRAVLGEDWITVQPDIYRYAVSAGSITVVKIVFSEYLAAEVIWDDRDLDPLESLERTLVQTENAEKNEIQGSDPDEIEQLESLYSIELPAIYKEFLLKMGRCAGNWDTDSLWYTDELPEARRRAFIFLEEAAEKGATNFKITDDIFIFLLGSDSDDEGEERPYILFFHTGINEDPPVYYFRFKGRPEQVTSSFSTWLQEQDEMLQEIDSLS